jgi:hypothetical protein
MIEMATLDILILAKISDIPEQEAESIFNTYNKVH